MVHWNLLGARILIGILFVGGAVQKIVDPIPVGGAIAALGLPLALIWPLAFVNLFAGLMLWAGVRTQAFAMCLAVYCAATSFFHLIPSDPWQMSIFVKNWAIAGGCLALAAVGSGRIATRPDGVFRN